MTTEGKEKMEKRNGWRESENKVYSKVKTVLESQCSYSRSNVTIGVDLAEQLCRLSPQLLAESPCSEDRALNKHQEHDNAVEKWFKFSTSYWSKERLRALLMSCKCLKEAGRQSRPWLTEVGENLKNVVKEYVDSLLLANYYRDPGCEKSQNPPVEKLREQADDLFEEMKNQFMLRIRILKTGGGNKRKYAGNLRKRTIQLLKTAYILSVKAKKTDVTIMLHLMTYRDAPSVKFIVNTGGDCNAQDIKGYTPLHYACENGHFEVTQHILIQCQNPLVMLQTKCKDGRTPLVMLDKNMKTILHHACEEGDILIVKNLVTAGAVLNAQDVKGYTPLHYACENGHFEVSLCLISTCQNQLTTLQIKCKDGRTSPMIADKNWRTMLHYACEKGDAVSAKKLVTGGADSNVQDVKGYTPLHYACENGYFKVAQFLIVQLSQNQLPMLQIECKDGHNPPVMLDENRKAMLHHACEKGDLFLVKNLVTAGAVLNAQDVKGYTPFHYACENGHFEVAQHLLIQCQNPLVMLENKCEDGRTPLVMLDKNMKTILHHACEEGDILIVKNLVTAGAVLNVKDVKGYTPLHYACASGHFEVARYLLIHCQKPLVMLENRCKDGRTPLVMLDKSGKTMFHHACEKGDAPSVKFIVSTDIKGYTPLHYACESGHFKIAQCLISQRQNNLSLLQIKCKDGHTSLMMADRSMKTILHHACKKGYVALVKNLVTAGANSNSQDAKGYTPLHYAYENGHFEVAQHLIDLCQNPSTILWVKCKGGRTPPVMLDETKKKILHYASENGKIKLVKNLVTVDANSISQDVKGYTPLHYACENGHFEVAQYLIDNCLNPLTMLKIKCKDERTPSMMTDEKRMTIADVVQCALHPDCRDLGREALSNDINNKQIDVAVAKFLITKGVIEGFLSTSPPRTALMWTAQEGDASLMKKLIFQGMNIKYQNSDGCTPMHFAAEHNHIQCGILLVKAEADVSIMNRASQTPFDPSSNDFKDGILLSFQTKKTVCVFGNTMSDKGTVVASLQNEDAWFWTRIFNRLCRVWGISECTAGVEPVSLLSKHYGDVIFFDFAGQHEYHGPHVMFLESILSKGLSTVTIIVVVKATEEESTICHQLNRWLYPFSSMSSSANPVWVIVIGSHVNEAKHEVEAKEKLQVCYRRVKDNLRDFPLKFDNLCYPDCHQPYSSDISKLCRYLKEVSPPRYKDVHIGYSVPSVISRIRLGLLVYLNPPPQHQVGCSAYTMGWAKTFIYEILSLFVDKMNSIIISDFSDCMSPDKAILPADSLPIEAFKKFSLSGSFPCEVYSVFSPLKKIVNKFHLLICQHLSVLLLTLDHLLVPNVLLNLGFHLKVDSSNLSESFHSIGIFNEGCDYLFFPELVLTKLLNVSANVPSKSEINHTLFCQMVTGLSFVSPRLLQNIFVQLAADHAFHCQRSSESGEQYCKVWCGGNLWQASDDTVVQVIGGSEAMVHDTFTTIHNLSSGVSGTECMIHTVNSQVLLGNPKSPSPQEKFTGNFIMKIKKDGASMSLLFNSGSDMFERKADFDVLSDDQLSVDVVRRFSMLPCVSAFRGLRDCHCEVECLVHKHDTTLGFFNEQYEPIIRDENEEPKTVAYQETRLQSGSVAHQVTCLESGSVVQQETCLETGSVVEQDTHLESGSVAHQETCTGSKESRSLQDLSSAHENGWKDCKDCIPWLDELPCSDTRADKPFKSAFSTKFPNVKRGKSEKNLADFENTNKFEDVQPLSRLTVQLGIDRHDTSASTFELEDIGPRKEPLGQEEVNSSPGVPTLPGQAVHVATGSSKNKGSSGYGTASHPQSTLLNAQYPSSGEKSDILQEPAEVVTDNSAENVVVSHRGQAIAESLMQQDNCMVHIPTAAIPDTAHKTTLVLGQSNSKPVIRTLKEYIKTKPELNLKPSVFLENLHLQDVLKLKELTDIPSYLVKRSRLERVFKKLPPASKPASLIDEEKAEAVVSSLKWLEKEQTDSLKKTLVSNRRKGWNDLKDSIRAVDMVFLPTLVSKLGIQIHFTAEPALSEFVGILDELSVVHRNCGLHNITKSQVIHALFVSSASTELLDTILLEDLPEKVSCVTISKVQKYADLYGATKEGYERFLAVILDDVSHKRDRNPLKVLPALPKSPSSVTHCLAVWLAVRAESPSSAVTWEEFVEMTRNLGLDESIIVQEQRLLVATSSLKPLNYEHNAAVEQTDGSPSNESKHLSTSEFPYGREPAGPDRYPSPAVQNDVHLKPSEEHPLSSRFELSSTSSNLAVQNSNTSSSHAFPRAESSHNRVSEEQLLSRKLDPGNPESVMAHAKAVYLTGDYNRTRAILEHFNHHLSVEGKMLRAKLFGLGITHYRQKHYPQAVQHLDELEKVAVEHHAASDVMLSNIYRGECHLAMEKYQAAYDMFNKAKTVYSTDHVAHLYGIVILSKTSVVIKAATCQRHLRNIIAARNLFQKAVEMAVVVREAAEPMSTSSLAFSDALKPLYKDEIAARTSLGNLHQNMSNCPKAVEEYKLALQLQKKLDSKCTTYGWAEGNLGNALVGAHKVKEAIPHLERAYEAAKKYQRDYTAVGRTASNLGSAYQSNKQYKEAEEHFEIALGHAVYCRDAIGQARSLGNIGNVKSAQGKHMDALRCYTETLSLDCDITANIAAYQNRANVYIDLARELAGGNDWDEVSSDVEAVQPKEVQSSEIPVQECTQAHGTGSMRLQLVAPEGSYIKLPLDDEQDILSNKQSLPVSSSGSARRTGSIQQQPLTPFNALGPDDLKVRHRKYYLQKAKDDLKKSTKLIEERFNTIKGEGTTSMALSLFEVNAKGFYNLQKVLTLLGDHQGALQVAEQNRARNLGEILWKKKQDYRLQHRDLPSPFGLKNIWNFVNRERVPLVVLSYIQQSSTMLVHIVFPEEEGSLWRGLPGGFPSGQSGMLVPSSYISEMGFSRNAVDILSTHQSEESEPFRIPSSNYCFMKIDLPKEYFIAKRYGSLARLVDEEPIAFEQYVQKTLMDYLNQKDVELFTPIDFQDDESPLTVLFERFARRFVEEIEQRWPTGREFVVVADQTAHFLPWPLLQDESTKVFLGDRYRVRTYPSLLTMGLMNLRGVEVIELPSQDRFLIIGNPTIPKFEHNGKEITLGRLPHAETEAVQVAHILEANPLLREMATKPTVEYRLQTAQIIHVATHASAVGGYLAFASSIPIVNTARPIDSKDALLFIDDIQKLRIDASLVVLSACDSARGQLVNEGVNSIARAFLAAGAQSVLVSLVRVPDKSASIFMSLFYRFLTHNEFTTSEAIQKSSMVIRCIKSLSQHIHWGGYRLVGRDIRMKYNEECEAAKVAKLLGETSAFPRMKILQELEKAIFRQDRTPPRDVVVVKGMMAYDPAEVVKDFVAKRFKLFPGGVFWYNCSTQKLLEASVKNTLRHLKTIRKEPPKQTRVPDKKRSLDSSPLFEEHYQLIILDSPYDFEKCVKAILNMNGQEVVIKDMNGQEVDIIVIDSMEADRDGSLTKFAHSELIRGCTSVEVEDIDRYTAIQRMAYQLLCKQDFCPYEEDYEAFETIVRFTRGCTSLVKVFEGLLATKEKGIVQEIVRDIEAMKDIVIEYDDEHTTSSLPPSLSSHRPMSTLASLSSAIKETGRKVGSHGKRPKESKKTESLVKNGLITADTAKRLSEDDCVLLSEGLEKLPRIMDSMNNFLTVQLTPESHFILQSLSFISQFSSEDSHSESSFCFPEDFVATLATLVAPASRAGSPKELVEELKTNNLLRPYPQPVLYPLEKTSSESSSLLYIPDVVVKSVTYEMDDADFAFAFNTLSFADHQVNGVSSVFSYQPVVSAVRFLKKKYDFFADSPVTNSNTGQSRVSQIRTKASNKHNSTYFPNDTQPLTLKMPSRKETFDHSAGRASHRQSPPECDSNHV